MVRKRPFLEKLVFSVVVLLFSKVEKIQIRSKIDEKSTLDPGPVFGSMFDDFWIDFGVIFDPKIDKKSMLQFDRFLDAFWEGLGAAQADLGEFEWIQVENSGGPGGG